MNSFSWGAAGCSDTGGERNHPGHNNCSVCGQNACIFVVSFAQTGKSQPLMQCKVPFLCAFVWSGKSGFVTWFCLVW